MARAIAAHQTFRDVRAFMVAGFTSRTHRPSDRIAATYDVLSYSVCVDVLTLAIVTGVATLRAA